MHTMRIVKAAEIRRNEILDAAESLFTTKGYAKTTIVDLLTAVGIGKGTFYYHFKSKEEVMEAVIDRIVGQIIADAKAIANKNSGVCERMLAVIIAGQSPTRSNKEQLIEQFHEPGNADMHQQSITKTINGLAPILAGLVHEGIEQKIFNNPYPQECMEILLAGISIIFDAGFFNYSPNEYTQRIQATVYMIEKVLGAQEHTFDFMYEILKK